MQKKTRRQFFKTMGALSATGLGSTLFCKSGSWASGTLSNVVCIIGDDHAAHVLGCYGNGIIRTPNLDRLASRGVRFTHAYANAPLCSASRQSLLTGKYPHACGVTLLRTSFPENQITIAEHLQQYGFKTGVVGKTHFNNGLPHGFEERTDTQEYRNFLEENPPEKPPANRETRPPWKPFRDPAHIWLNADGRPSQYYDKDDIGTFLANKAVEFIDRNKKGRFCLFVGFHEPHSPFNFPIEYAGKYKPEDMPLPKGSPEDDRWIPQVFKDLSDEEKRGIIASYYTSVEYMDKNVGLILDELERTGLDKNTLVIYIGDQGYLLGHHKRFEKHMMWEEALRSPLIIQAGGRFGEGRSVEVLTEFIDLAPTIMQALGIEPMTQVQGKSLMPVLLGTANNHKDVVFSEFLADNKAMLRTKEWKYIFTSGKRDLGQGYATGHPPSGICHRLYNVKNDPEEFFNVANSLENKTILDSLQKQMLKLFNDTHPKADQLPEGLSVDQQLVWFCEPPDANADLEAK